MTRLRHFRVSAPAMLALALTTVFAISAIAATAASAAPELQNEQCVKAAKEGKKYTGRYNDKACTESNAKSEGKYELAPVAEGTKFTSKTKAITLKADGKTITCKKGSDAGEDIGGGFSLVTFTFSSCTGGSKTETCQSGATAGTITSNLLFGILVYVNEAETQDGIVLVPAESGWASFKCGAQTIELEGSLEGTVTNTSKGETFTFAVNGSNEQANKYNWAGSKGGPFNLYTGAEVEATLVGTDEQGPKGVGAF